MMDKKNIEKILGNPTEEYEKFHELTKLDRVVTADLPRNLWPEEWKRGYYKSYFRLEEVKLPKPSLSKKPFLQVLNKRQSTRRFSNKKISIKKLSNLLYYCAGLSPNKNKFKERRFYPSGGARFPLEVYVASLNTDLPKGIYHYYVKNHSLEKLDKFSKKDLIALTPEKWIKDTACVVFITAVFKRNTVKYGNRGYRHVLVECGHMAQNLYLLSSAMDLGVCIVGGYVDTKVNAVLDVDGVEESVIYIMGFGERK